MSQLKLVIIDNYDSFTYNLVETVRQLKLEVDITVIRNDKFQIEELEVFDKIMLSPGPGIPDEAGLLKQVIQTYSGKKPILGVCLGHQAIGEVFGSSLINLDAVLHGIETRIQIQGHYLFDGIGQGPIVGRYHSWVIDPASLTDELRVISIDDNGQIMGVAHNRFDVCGIQFHPESVMTPSGAQMLHNWISH